MPHPKFKQEIDIAPDLTLEYIKLIKENFLPEMNHEIDNTLIECLKSPKAAALILQTERNNGKDSEKNIKYAKSFVLFGGDPINKEEIFILFDINKLTDQRRSIDDYYYYGVTIIQREGKPAMWGKMAIPSRILHAESFSQITDGYSYLLGFKDFNNEGKDIIDNSEDDVISLHTFNRYKYIYEHFYKFSALKNIDSENISSSQSLTLLNWFLFLNEKEKIFKNNLTPTERIKILKNLISQWERYKYKENPNYFDKVILALGNLLFYK